MPVPWGYRGPTRTSQDRLSPAGSLHPEPRPQDSRFGSALGAVPNLSQDGLAGAVVGAPLEDGHRGALYVFHGAPGTLLPQYKQVRRRWERWEGLGVTVAVSTTLYEPVAMPQRSFPAHRGGCAGVEPPVFRDQRGRTGGHGRGRAGGRGRGGAGCGCSAAVSRGQGVGDRDTPDTPGIRTWRRTDTSRGGRDIPGNRDLWGTGTRPGQGDGGDGGTPGTGTLWEQ